MPEENFSQFILWQADKDGNGLWTSDSVSFSGYGSAHSSKTALL